MDFRDANLRFENSVLYRESCRTEEAEDEEDRLLQEAEDAALDEPIDQMMMEG